MSKTVSFQTILFHHARTILFQTIWFSISTQFSSIWPIARTPSRVTTPSRVELGVMAMKENSAFPKAPALLTSPSDCFVSYPEHSYILPLCRETVDVLYSRSRLGNETVAYWYHLIDKWHSKQDHFYLKGNLVYIFWSSVEPRQLSSSKNWFEFSYK